jgi:hypothetical protein
MAAQTHVLPFGCTRTQRMYRALIPGPVPHYRAKTEVVVIPCCPGCGAEHSVLSGSTFGRALRPGEDDVDVNLAGHIPAPAPAPAVPPLGTHDRGTTKTPDADLLAAIPTDRQAAAADIARALSVADTATMLERIERLNARALSAWGHQLVRIIRTDTGRRPVYLQRTEPQPKEVLPTP